VAQLRAVPFFFRARTPASELRLHVLFSQCFAGMVEPDDFIPRLKDGVPVAVDVFVNASGGNRGQLAAGAFAARIAPMVTWLAFSLSFWS
jgi:hypothetical protein